MKKIIQRYRGYFSYQEKALEYSFWSNTPDGQKPDVVIFLGAGQTGAIPRMVAKRAGAGTVVVGGLPHWHASSDAEDIEDFTISYFENAFQKILATFNLDVIHILAESQAAPAALILASKLSGIKNLCLIRPLGFSVQAFGSTRAERLKTFRKRILHTSLQYPQSFLYDPRNIAVGLILIRAMLRESTLLALNKKYAAGISYDSLQDLQTVARSYLKTGRTVSFILGEKDKMFPPEEIMAALDTIDVPHVITIAPSISHSSLATRSSQKVLRMALESVRGSKQKELNPSS